MEDLEDRTVIFQVIWVKRIFCFVLSSGLKRAVLKLEGKMPEARESLITEVMSGRRQSRHSSSKWVGNASRSQVLEAELRMVYFTKSSLTGSKLRRGRPWKQGSEQLGGSDAWQSRLFLLVCTFLWKNSRKRWGSSMRGKTVGRGDVFLLPSNWFVILNSCLHDRLSLIMLQK